MEAGPGNSRGLSTEHTLELGISPTPHHAKMSTIAATTVSEHPSEHSATWFYGVPLAARGSKLTHRVSFSRGSVSKRFPPRKEATARKSLRVTCASVAAPIGCLLVKLRRTKKKNAGKRIFLFPLGISGGNSVSFRRTGCFGAADIKIPNHTPTPTQLSTSEMTHQCCWHNLYYYKLLITIHHLLNLLCVTRSKRDKLALLIFR